MSDVLDPSLKNDQTNVCIITTKIPLFEGDFNDKGLRYSFISMNYDLFDPDNCVSSTNYLVDPASSHMLVSKIKPCMSKYKQLYRETANGSLNQLSFIW